MLQRKDLLELTRRFTIDRCHLDRVAGAYFDRENEIDGTFNVHMQDLSPHEKNVNLSHFKDVLFGPTNETVVEMPCPGSYAESDKEWYQYNNLMDVLSAAGYKTFWLSNQESSGIWGNVAQLYANRCTKKAYTSLRESREDHGRLDEELLPLLDAALAEPGEKNFYVLHLMGGHGLYYMRFPYLFTKFTAEDIHGEQAELSEEKYLVSQFERYNEKFLNRVHTPLS